MTHGSQRTSNYTRQEKGGHQQHAHGGAWKIAYADFMTAMMAFFLVMWLIPFPVLKS